MNVTRYTIREFQDKLLEILLVLDEFLKRNDIHYFLIGGSSLGAVRHKGFIPWDDDIDIGMPREEFERFEGLDFSFLAERKLQYCKIGQNVILNAPIGFLYDRSDESVPYEECLTIDIFPIDDVPASAFKQKLQKIVSHIYHISVGRRPAQNRGKAAKILTTVIVKLTPDFMFDLYEKWAKRAMISLGESTSGLAANIFGMKGYYREIMPKNIIEETEDMLFEGHFLPVQKNYDQYLKRLFGDYMELPPESERKPHHKCFED